MRTGGGCRTVDREISRFPRKERLHMPGSLTTPGRPALAMTRSDVLPSTICTVSAPKIGLFRGSMAGLCAPLSTLRRDPRGPLRMTWGRCGSLLLHRKGLSPSTPCRSPGASHILSASDIPDRQVGAKARHRPHDCDIPNRSDCHCPQSGIEQRQRIAAPCRLDDPLRERLSPPRSLGTIHFGPE
jgi:hypothetical protein